MYDTMRTEGHYDHNHQDDLPPWEDKPKPKSAAEIADRKELDRLGYADKKNWNEVYAEKAEIARKRIDQRLSNPNGGTFAEDEEGLQKAYADTTAQSVYYNPDTRTLYVKGTVPTSAKDWWDDVSKIPFWGDIHDADRMKEAEAAYNDLIAQGKPVDRVVGHSLGASVSLQLQTDKGTELSRTFGAPVWDPFGIIHRGSQERYRHALDPVSNFDRGATWGSFNLYPHTYSGFRNFDPPRKPPRGDGVLI